MLRMLHHPASCSPSLLNWRFMGLETNKIRTGCGTPCASWGSIACDFAVYPE